jgi:hypothetical protein
MNQNFVNIIKRIIAEQGEALLADPQHLKAYVSDYAKNEAPAERLAFGRCIEYGAYHVLKTAPDRAAAKAALARKVCGGEGLDIALCQSALDALEAALFGTVPGRRQAQPAVSPPVPAYRQYQHSPPSVYQQPQYRQAPPVKTGNTIKTIKFLIFIVLGCYIAAVVCNVAAINNLDRDMIGKNGMSLVMEVVSRLGVAQTLGLTLDILGNTAGTDYSSALLQNRRAIREFVNVLFDWYAPVQWSPVLSASKEIGWLLFQNRLNKLKT